MNLRRLLSLMIQPLLNCLQQRRELLPLNMRSSVSAFRQRRELLPLRQNQKLSQKTRTGSIENIETRTRRKIGNIRSTSTSTSTSIKIGAKIRIKTRIETERRKTVDTMIGKGKTMGMKILMTFRGTKRVRFVSFNSNDLILALEVLFLNK